MTKKEVLALSNSELDKAVKIQGTKFDRKRKLSNSTIDRIKYLSSCGKSFYAIANMLGLNYATVRYHSDEAFRWKVNHRGGSHAQSSIYTPSERANYKRGLVSANAHVIYPM